MSELQFTEKKLRCLTTVQLPVAITYFDGDRVAEEVDFRLVLTFVFHTWSLVAFAVVKLKSD